MRFDLVTIFPGLCRGPLGEGIVRRAIDRGLVDVRVHDLRDFTSDRHRSVDDVSYGGGPGMVFKPEPLFRAVDAIREDGPIDAIVLTSPQGRRFTQREAERLARQLEHALELEQEIFFVEYGSRSLPLDKSTMARRPSIMSCQSCSATSPVDTVP